MFDVVLALLEAARTGYAVTRTDADYQGSTLSRPSDIAIGASLMTLAAISAGVGFNRVSACNDAINDRRRRPPPPPAGPPPRRRPTQLHAPRRRALRRGRDAAARRRPPGPGRRSARAGCPAAQQQTDTE